MHPTALPDINFTRRISWFIWAIAAVMLVAVLTSYWAVGLSLDIAEWRLTGLMSLCLGITIVYRLWRPDPWISTGAESTVQLLTIMLMATLLTYPAAAAGFPYRDAELYAVDRWLGFDWRAYLDFVNAHPWLGPIFNLAYFSMKLQFALVIGALIVTSHFVRLQQYIVSIAVSLALTIPIFMLVPALAYYAHLGLTPADFANITPAVPYSHIPHLEGMRSGVTQVIRLSDLEGMITFPSFHTTAAITFCWALWPLRKLRWWVVGLNALLILSTPIDGAHYLIDIVAGAAIATLAIVGARAVISRVGAPSAGTPAIARQTRSETG